METDTLPTISLPNDVLERVAAMSNQAELDYFVFCACAGKKDAAYNALIAAGFSADDTDAFISEVETLHNADLDQVNTVKDALQMSNDDLVELANAILRIMT
jgi:hypothetical protein